MKPTAGKKNPNKNHSYQSTSTEKGIGYETQIRKKTNKIILPKEFYPEKQLDMKPISEKNQTQIIPPKEFDQKASGYETHITKKKNQLKIISPTEFDRIQNPHKKIQTRIFKLHFTERIRPKKASAQQTDISKNQNKGIPPKEFDKESNFPQNPNQKNQTKVSELAF